MNITNYKISIKGLNLHHAIDYFQKEKIHLSNVERESRKKLVCTISKTDYKKFKKAPISKGFKIHIEKRYGLEGYLNSFLRKIGLLVGIIIMGLTTINLTNSIKKITLNTQNHICQNGDQCIFHKNNIDDLYSELSSLGIHTDAKIQSIASNKEIKQKLMLKFPQISEVSVQRKGVNVNINILEAKLPTNTIQTNLIAQENGIVIKTNVTSGNLKVKIGDIVLKGDTLIENTGTPACGSVTLRTFYHENIIFNEEQITYERTGNVIHLNDIHFFGINFESSNKNTFSLYETEESCKYLSVNSLLPIKIHQTTYYELKQKNNTLSFENEKNRLYAELEEKTKLLVPSSAEIKNTTFTIKQEGTRFLVNCYVETYLTLSI